MDYYKADRLNNKYRLFLLCIVVFSSLLIAKPAAAQLREIEFEGMGRLYGNQTYETRGSPRRENLSDTCQFFGVLRETKSYIDVSFEKTFCQRSPGVGSNVGNVGWRVPKNYEERATVNCTSRQGDPLVKCQGSKRVPWYWENTLKERATAIQDFTLASRTSRSRIDISISGSNRLSFYRKGFLETEDQDVDIRISVNLGKNTCDATFSMGDRLFLEISRERTGIVSERVTGEASASGTSSRCRAF